MILHFASEFNGLHFCLKGSLSLLMCSVALGVLFHRLPGKCIEFTLPPIRPNDNASQDVFELPNLFFQIENKISNYG